MNCASMSSAPAGGVPAAAAAAATARLHYCAGDEGGTPHGEGGALQQGAAPAQAAMQAVKCSIWVVRLQAEQQGRGEIDASLQY